MFRKDVLKSLLFAVLMAFACVAQAVVYSLPWGPKPQFVDANGAPMSSGTLTFYTAGTSTPQNTYTDSTGSVANSNPLTLNSRGEPANEIWLSAGVSYKLVLKDSGGSTIWTVDNITGVNDVTAQVGQEWVASSLTPTFVSTTSFTLTGDQRTTFHVGRRLKTTNSGGTIYSTITAVAFGAVTTVTVANDSGVLDSGLSAVSYGVVSSTNTSISPDMVHRKGTAVASAATTDIWSIVGDYVHVTGTTTITSLGTAPYAGAVRTVIFDGALVLTHNATTLVLPGGLNIKTAANDRMVVRADTPANMVVLAYQRADGAAVMRLPPKAISGLTWSNNVADATNDIDIAAGSARDATDATDLILSSAITKQSDATWAVGTNAGCLDSGAVGNNDYYIWLIKRSDTAVVDALCSLSSTSPTMPTNYDYKRLIGWFKRSGGTIVAFKTYETEGGGIEFLWDAPRLDIDLANTLTTSRRTDALSVPLNFSTTASLNVFITDASSTQNYLYSPDQSDQAPSTTASPLHTVLNGTGTAMTSNISVRTSATGTIAARSNTATVDTYRVVTVGFRWARRN